MGHERAFRSRLASDGCQSTGRHCRVTMSLDWVIGHSRVKGLCADR
ncbi:hypothetical protein STVIR_4071 [Streptomyces viridochromogenes Tue57]|uniref:Uncharacterized protein n=1 Tax=Streptomyces viridochromogenes Tue57 TaxID=1160705 RepID=L8PEQ5_STRVR|nr:hypothetical protein STVIR_4071 [Streptomyces viridochromogenes Tue57]